MSKTDKEEGLEKEKYRVAALEKFKKDPYFMLKLMAILCVICLATGYFLGMVYHTVKVNEHVREVLEGTINERNKCIDFNKLDRPKLVNWGFEPILENGSIIGIQNIT